MGTFKCHPHTSSWNNEFDKNGWLFQYPHWLDENRDKTAKDQLEKYLQQQRIVGEICVEFETEQPSETDERKKLRFERIIDLMQQVRYLFNEKNYNDRVLSEILASDFVPNLFINVLFTCKSNSN